MVSNYVFAYYNIVIKSLNVSFEVIIYPSESAYVADSGPGRHRQPYPRINLPVSESSCSNSRSLHLICPVCDCILMLPNRSNREYPLLGVSTRKGLYRAPDWWHYSLNWLICLASPALERLGLRGATR